MNIDTVRTIFGNLQIGLVPADGQNALTALAVRAGNVAAVLDAEDQEDARVFGVGANAAVMDRFLQQAPIMRSFCLANCNVAPFHGNFSGQSVVKMAQFLSYIRLLQADVIRDMGAASRAQYQAYALAELFGPHLPDDHKLPQAQSHLAIRTAVHWVLQTEDPAIPENWHHAALGVGDTVAAVRAIPLADLTIHQALIILEAMSAILQTSQEWLNGISMITTVVTSLSKQGNLSNKAKIKIINGVRTDHPGPEVILPDRTVRVFHNNFAKYVTAENAEEIFDHYEAIIPETSIRLLTLVEQAAESGMTVFNIIRRALNEHGDFRYWPQAFMQMPLDVAHFIDALQAVGANRYYGFNRNLGVVAASRFKSLGYLAQQILVVLGGDEPLSRYGGLKGAIPHSAWIDHIIERVGEEAVQFADLAQPNEAILAQIQQVRNLLNPQL